MQRRRATGLCAGDLQKRFRIYVNGAKRYSGVNFPNVFTTTGGVFAPGVNRWDAPCQGSMDDPRIYGAALSDGEISCIAR